MRFRVGVKSVAGLLRRCYGHFTDCKEPVNFGDCNAKCANQVIIM